MSLLYVNKHSILPVLGVIFCCYTLLSEVETAERERNILNENVMNVTVLKEKRKLQKEEKAEVVRNLYLKIFDFQINFNFSKLFKMK